MIGFFVSILPISQYLVTFNGISPRPQINGDFNYSGTETGQLFTNILLQVNKSPFR